MSTGLQTPKKVPLYELWRDTGRAQLIAGNTSLEVRQRILELCSTHFTLCGRGFGDQIVARLEIIEATVSKERDEARVVCEIDVEDDMLDIGGKVPGGCLVFFTSLISALPHIILDLSTGGVGAKGAAQVLDTMIHSTACAGDRLRMIGWTLSRDHSKAFGRCEFWSVKHGKLVASASQVKADGSAGNKAKSRSGPKL